LALGARRSMRDKRLGRNTTSPEDKTPANVVVCNPLLPECRPRPRPKRAYRVLDGAVAGCTSNAQKHPSSLSPFTRISQTPIRFCRYPDVFFPELLDLRSLSYLALLITRNCLPANQGQNGARGQDYPFGTVAACVWPTA
jgi:hypothetical protein